MYIILGFICVGPGARLVVMFCRGAFCVAVPVIVLRVFLGNVISFWSTFVLGGGGCDIPWYTVPAGKYFVIDVCLVHLGHIKMWRVRLSWDSRVTCSRVS